MDKFEQYKLSLTSKQKGMVNGYLLKVKNFVTLHQIQIELYNDIEEMVFEKLSLEKEITDLRVTKMLQEVGEPEVIFADFVENLLPKEELLYEKLTSSGWTRDNNGAVFLGISKTLAEKIGISQLAVRILLFVLIFPLGISVWFYILAGILLPVAGMDYSGKNNVGFLRTQLVLVIRNGVYNLSQSFVKFFTLLVKYFYVFIKNTLSFIVKNILPLIRFFFFGMIAFGFSLAVLALVSVGSFYFTHFSIENIDFVASLPNYFIYGIACGTYALFIFALASFLYGVSKKILNVYLFFSGGIAFLVALFLGISTGLDIVQKYAGTSDFTQTAQIEIANTGSYIMDLRKLSDMKDIDLEFFGFNAIVLEHSTGSMLKVQVKNTIRGNDEIYKKVTKSMAEISFVASDQRLELAPKNNTIFSHKVPFTLISRDLVITVPEGVEIAIVNNDRYYFENAFISNKYEKYSNYLRNDCRNAPIHYDMQSSQFTCDVSPDELLMAKQEYLRQYLVEHFTEISPIQHKEVFKRNYYGDYGAVSDWNFPSIEFVGTGSEVHLQFSDRSLDVTASLSIQETSSGVLVDNFKINDVQVDRYQFDEKYYTSIDAIKDFLKEERD